MPFCLYLCRRTDKNRAFATALSFTCDKLQHILTICVHQFVSSVTHYLQISIDEVKDKDSGHADEELCGGTEAAQVDSQDSQLLHGLDVR